MDDFDAGIAFIVEGHTERVFYSEYMRHLSESMRFEIEEVGSVDTEDYAIASHGRRVHLRINNVGSVSQIANAGVWFRRSCVAREDIPWYVFLAYDTDSHSCPISKFHEGDWARLREDLSAAHDVVDLAAEADIEDVMLCDPRSVLAYLGLPEATDIPKGGKGKSRMKRLYKSRCQFEPYQAGSRARGMIRALDFDHLEREAPIGLRRIREVLLECFGPAA